MNEGSGGARRGLRRLLLALLMLLVLAGAGAGWLLLDFQRFADAPMRSVGEPLVLEVAPGDSLRRVVRRLRLLGITEGVDAYWQLLATRERVIRRIKVGEFRLEPGITPRQLLLKLGRGEVIQYRVTLVEGWNFREVRAALARAEPLVQTLAGLSDEEIMRRLDAPGEHPEGRFLPETYHYTRGADDLGILRRAHTALQTQLDEVWQARAPGLPLHTPYEALILASIIEKETAVPSEREMISGVFVRRLQRGMLLQTDPTVIYGLGSAFDGNLTRVHLRSDTPYNTYTRAGLPPTPIAMPGRASLHAAVNPAPGEWLYFVSRGDGSHEFTSSLQEHNRAVARYQLRRAR